MALATALDENMISPKHKVFLAFALSKAFWQYYESDWMKVEWSSDTVQLLQTASLDSKAPFLRVIPAHLRGETFSEHESETMSGQSTHLHPYPYIFNLGLLLFQLGSADCREIQISADAENLSGIEKNNRLLLYCCKEIVSGQDWPTLAIPAQHKTKFQRAVKTCFPIDSPSFKDLFENSPDVSARRLILKNHVVDPLLELYQDMADIEEAEIWLQRSTRVGKSTVLQTGTGSNKTLKTQSDLASDWLNSMSSSWLHTHVTEKLERMKRPKIAIIDTGFDDETIVTHWRDRKLQKRLNMLPKGKAECNWKDFWQPKTIPLDIDGHGTAMLSIVHRVAPFADICVARIAGGDEDLKQDAIKTSQNLAKAIRWAVEEQDADIVSLSLGWEQEPCHEEERIVSNAISSALAKRNRNVLIFAAASNLGGGMTELFPAYLPEVISVRAVNTEGQNPGFNPSLPKGAVKVFGTLGVEVPARQRHGSGYINHNGTSVATAIMAGIAAIIIGYININMDNTEKRKSWLNIRTPEGFQRLLHQLSTESQPRQLFMTLKHHSEFKHQSILEAALTSASNPKPM
ncbi:uncharacterized protein SETTUDRAFT_25785 [Exserohilum turcica Et28A]|uniref:Peptidase S8/S53 domain-containing protein n=1 Tax=Exserohilum turcicum (strain 28A) TaxID=671987 RepID=R0KC81_EXST2|nr:uncharacterized protein SETTUDRAFT_25785 [Exserohilum turcica Et28A]EOA90523.1 hypothetical protein SETTUDRAFT_25785 [Exserohilum turcica Et28A]